MDFSVLSPDFKKQLEQQLTRLQQERESIIAQAAQSVDENIIHINALLGGEVAEAPVKRPYKRKEEPAEVRTKRPYNRKQPNSPKSKKTSKAKQVKAPKSKSNGSDFPVLKPSYSSMSPAEAIVSLLNTSPRNLFTLDDVITGIYGTIDEAQLPKTRQRMGVTLGHCARRKECIKIDGEIVQFQAI